MKVGIMSMHRVKNLGSFMQAYGLKSMVESLGHSVFFIDYKKGEKTTNNGNVSDKKNKNLFIDKIRKCRYFYNIIRFKKKFEEYYNIKYEEELKKYLNINEEDCREKCDVLIVGSDEVFNCLNNQYGFSNDAFGGYKNAKKIISYAASCGWTKYEFLTEEQKKTLSESVPNFQAISVRDENTKYFISKFYEKEININLDPVLISDFSKFNKKSSVEVKESYIIIYAYYNRFSDKAEIQKIRDLAKKERCKLIAVGSPQYWCDDFVAISPYEIFDFFKKSKYVITDTFHGTIFSILSHCKFITIVRNSNSNKLTDLLKRLGLENRKYQSGDIRELINKEIDYNAVDNILEEEKKKSIEFLKNNLQ